jgi:DNA-binding CsgD family transcriptional regulator
MLTRVAAYGHAGDIERARMLLEQSVQRYGLTVAAVQLQLFDALVAERESKEAERRSLGKAAAIGFARLGWPYYQAQALEAAGEPEEALAIYRQIGDTRDARRLETAATSLKRRGKPNTALTSRESEVADLIADGLTSREIAQTLGISEHTVIHHVESIFNRLGIRTRSQLAAHVARNRAM